jgi:DNA-directed RNA polymerase subunit RPC12/RpoP
MNDEAVGMVCMTCGRIAEDESAARLAWVFAVEERRQVWTCDLCGREHLRSIEGKLNSAWW